MLNESLCVNKNSCLFASLNEWVKRVGKGYGGCKFTSISTVRINKEIIQPLTLNLN